MKKYFLRYLIYILLITLCSITVLSGFTFFQYYSARKVWRNAIYESCITELENNIKNSSYPDLKIDGLNLFGTIARDKRISGYLVRNSSGAVVLTVGQTPDEQVLASFFDEETITSGKEVKTKRRSITLDVTTSTNDVFTIDRKNDIIEKSTTFLPDFIDDNDILGSITVSFADDIIFSVDILSYSPRTFAYSKQIINPILKSLMISVPLSILIAIAGAYGVSSRNMRYIDSVRVALRKLARGESNIKIPKYNHSELSEIGSAIAELDKSLQSNKRSRNTWLRSISHDLNTPVSAMKIIIDGLSDGFFEADPATLSELKIQNDTLTERIKRVIDYSTLIAETEIHKEEIDVSAFIESIKIDFNGICKGASDKDGKDCFSNEIEFTTDLDTLTCDIAHMRRAVIELLKNAVENNADSEKVLISITQNKDSEEHIQENNASSKSQIKRLARKGLYFRKKTNTPQETTVSAGANLSYTITVKNKGSLPKDVDCNSLFEPWTKGTYSRSGEGNGLGLAIVGAIMHLHAGKAKLEETEGYTVATLLWSSPQEQK